MAATRTTNQFYLCQANGCNRKYKTQSKLVQHYVTNHPNAHVSIPVKQFFSSNKFSNSSNVRMKTSRVSKRRSPIRSEKQSKEEIMQKKMLQMRLRKETEIKKKKLLEEQERERVRKLQHVQEQADKLHCQSVQLMKQAQDVARLQAESKRKERELENMKKQLEEAFDRIGDKPEEYSSEETPIELTDSNMCKVCLDEIADTAFTPCGHKVTCEDCADTIKRTTSKCPMCRRYVLKLMRIYD